MRANLGRSSPLMVQSLARWVVRYNLNVTSCAPSSPQTTAHSRPGLWRAPALAPPVSPWRFNLIESVPTPVGGPSTHPHLVALVRADAVFKNGKLIERPDGSEGGDQQVA